MRISIVMCTRNRAQQLRRVLDSAVGLLIPPGLEWEFVLVDNGSTDDTTSVAMSYANRLPIRCVREEKPGLSNARNRGVAEARGEYICWTDDDVIIDPNWLTAYAEAFDRHPEAAFFGGVIEPVLEGETPDWFKENRPILRHLLAQRDFGEDQIELSLESAMLPYGANYAVRGNEQRTYSYDASLGVSPGLKRLGEEVEVLTRICQAGGTGIWVPAAKIKHIIPQARQTLDYVSVYQRSNGETWAYLSCTNPAAVADPILMDGARFLGAPRWIWRKAVTHYIGYIVHSKGCSSRTWLEHWSRAAYFWGAISYFRRQAKEVV